MNGIRYYLPGIILILIALLVIAVPEILVAFVASIIIIAGIAALYIGHRIRKTKTEPRNADGSFPEEDYFGSGSLSRPVFRIWHRWF